MRVYISGSDKVYAIENFYVKYLRELGIDVFHFPAQTIFYDYYQLNLINKIVFKLGFSPILKKIQQQFKKTVQEFSPDIIWIFKGMEIEPKSLIWAKEKGIKLVNFNGDSPFIFSGKGSGNSFVKDSIPLFDLHLTYSSVIKKEIEQKYGIDAAILPFGFDISDALYEKCCAQHEIIKTCFVGNPDVHRAAFIHQLAESGIEIDVYGNNWKQFVAHKNIQVFAPVYNDELWFTLYKYRVQLNLMRPHNLNTHNMRTFEVAGVGGIQLASDTPDHKKYFNPEVEIFLFRGVKDCKALIEKILSFTKSEATAVRNAARNRSISTGYSYQARVSQVLPILNKIKNIT